MSALVWCDGNETPLADVTSRLGKRIGLRDDPICQRDANGISTGGPEGPKEERKDCSIILIAIP